MAKKYLRCSVCGQTIEVIKDTGAVIICCAEPMEEIHPKVDEPVFGEKHIPKFKIQNNKVLVQVGAALHPSTTDHHIEWITLETTKGSQTIELKPGDSPVAVFNLSEGEQVKAVYAYCNIHSLWKACVKEKKKPSGYDIHME